MKIKQKHALDFNDFFAPKTGTKLEGVMDDGSLLYVIADPDGNLFLSNDNSADVIELDSEMAIELSNYFMNIAQSLMAAEFILKEQIPDFSANNVSFNFPVFDEIHTEQFKKFIKENASL
jgi:hypothetical protein